MGRLGRAVLDLLYCLLTLLTFVLFMLIYAGGQVRWYIPGGAVIGLFLYFAALTDYVRAALLPLIRMIRRAGGACKRFVLRAFYPPRGS
jgi:hypothetical protein